MEPHVKRILYLHKRWEDLVDETRQTKELVSNLKKLDREYRSSSAYTVANISYENWLAMKTATDCLGHGESDEEYKARRASLNGSLCQCRWVSPEEKQVQS